MSSEHAPEPGPAGPLTVRPDPSKALLEWGFAGLGARYMTGIDESTPAGRMLVMQCLNSKGQRIDSFINVQLKIANYLFTPALFLDESTGEEVATVVSKLVLDDGAIIETHSKGVCKSLVLAIQYLPTPPWQPPLLATPKSQPLRGAKSWIVLDFDMSSIQKKGKVK